MRIQHNILAMNAYRNYNTNTSALSKNLEKLSSGYKINRAGDDAAGLAISEKMRAQITGLNAAQKNVKDGISLVKTAEGAMQEIQDMLNRMDYLATQSANGTYDDEVDRKNLQKEVDQLRTEINRIADSANFNGIQLLDGSQSKSGSNGVSVAMDLKIEDAACKLGQLHEKGKAAQKVEFDIDLKQAANNLVAKSTIAGANATIGTFTINVGNKDINVKMTLKNAVTYAEGAAIKFDDITFALTDTSITTAPATFNDGSNEAKLTVTLNTDRLTFKLTDNAAAVDFKAALPVEIKVSSASTKVRFDQNLAAVKGDGKGASTFNCNTINPQTGVALKNDQLAHGEFEFTKEMANALVKGGTLQIGDQKITFDKDLAYGSSVMASGAITNIDDDGKVTTTVDCTVGVKDLIDGNGNLKVDDDSLAEMVTRIARAANGNGVFTVGAGSSDKMITLQERRDFYDGSSTSTHKDGRVLDTEEKFKAMVSVTGGATTNAAGGLTLQIGDTAASYNQLTVSIGDMHTSAMKSATNNNTIADISIATRDDAQAAIQTIRDAINYVSEVRGDLGATQNRLEHTANNLSVMAENIQDAESTIRDTDIAEEMMSYTKNNILVQSAQAMLAQANAVPQGVLQLLG